ASRAPCTTADADALGYVGGLSDLGLRTRQACGDFAEDLLSIGYAAGSGASTGPLLRCQRAVAARLRRLRGRVIAAFGPGCFVPVLAGRGCARRVTIEVYYPSTPAAVAGVPHDVAEVLGIPVATTPAFRNVARAPGPFPLVLFSHGNGGIRFQSLFLCAHLASHGYVVASPDHRGDTFV